MTSRYRRGSYPDPRLYGDLQQVVTPEGIQASNWRLFQGAIFGRDSLQVGLDLYQWHPEVAERVIFSLARLQGLETDPVTEEEPGRIHHEYRSTHIGGVRVNDESIDLLHQLSKDWGGTENELVYYGTVDATPLYVRLVSQMVSHHGFDLDRRFIHRRGGERTVRQSVLDAITWIEARLERSELGLLEFHRTNPKGHPFQVMRDGRISYLHPDGSLANAEAPIASLEVQGLAVDALRYAAELFPDDHQKEGWLNQAGQIVDQTVVQFWVPDERFFATALDRDPATGGVRQVLTHSSIQGELLETSFFDGFSPGERQLYAGSIVSELFGPDFLTDVGVRMRSLRHIGLIDYLDYQGCEASWPVTANIIARGLRRQGLYSFAEELESRLVSAVERSRRCLEIFYVDRHGVVNYDPMGYVPFRPGGKYLAATNLPEHVQAWTVSAVLRIQRERDESPIPLQESDFWAAELAEDVLGRLHSPFGIDTEAGREHELHFLASRGLGDDPGILERTSTD